MTLQWRNPWNKPKPRNRRGKWVWAFAPRMTGSGRKWMCWVWRETGYFGNVRR